MICDRQASITKKAKHDTCNCLKSYTMWKRPTKQQCNTAITALEQNSDSPHSGSPQERLGACMYPPKSLHHIVAGFQQHSQYQWTSQVDLFKEERSPAFIDAEMKRIQLGIRGLA